jgi:hypothetical protein
MCVAPVSSALAIELVQGSHCPSEAAATGGAQRFRVTGSSILHVTQAAPAGEQRHTTPAHKAAYVYAVSVSPL